MSTQQQNPNGVIINLQDVHKIYQMGRQQVKALRGISISFKSGSFWAIMGPSGSGKSTMLNILGCLDRITSGKYTLQANDVSTLDDNALSELRLRYLGFIFQSFNLIAQLTVQKNIELPLYYLGWDAEQSSARAVEIAQSVGLEGRLKHRPSELSGGQLQRVAIARALANDPEILLADEPTGNLDTATGEQILELLDELNQQGKTIIMVTHEANIAAHAKRKMHMRDGLIESIEGQD
jgi:putative ABC transport system ATP-binding protein